MRRSSAASIPRASTRMGTPVSLAMAIKVGIFSGPFSAEGSADFAATARAVFDPLKACLRDARPPEGAHAAGHGSESAS